MEKTCDVTSTHDRANDRLRSGRRNAEEPTLSRWSTTQSAESDSRGGRESEREKKAAVDGCECRRGRGKGYKGTPACAAKLAACRFAQAAIQLRGVLLHPFFFFLSLWGLIFYARRASASSGSPYGVARYSSKSPRNKRGREQKQKKNNYLIATLNPSLLPCFSNKSSSPSLVQLRYQLRSMWSQRKRDANIATVVLSRLGTPGTPLFDHPSVRRCMRRRTASSRPRSVVKRRPCRDHPPARVCWMPRPEQPSRFVRLPGRTSHTTGPVVTVAMVSQGARHPYHSPE